MFIKVAAMSQQIQCWKVEGDGAALAGEIHRILGVSHRQSKGLIDARCVTVNGEPIKTYGHRLCDGDEVKVDFDSDTTYHEAPSPSKSDGSAVKILWEDKHLVFLDKPAGVLSVPTEHDDDASLADELVEHYHQRGIKRPQIYIAHRLDRFTTGVMVFAKTPEALNGLKDLFREHDINRIYRAILVGEIPENSGTLHDKVAEKTRWLKMVVVARRAKQPRPEAAKPAVTNYRVIERLPGHTVVELKLETGRRNQIRVQFADRGYPLLGDKIYGAASPLLDRQALHAETLGLRHPVTGENILVQSPLPEDMEAALKKLRVRRRVARAKAGISGEEGLFKPRATKEKRQSRILRAKQYERKERQNDDAPRKTFRFKDGPPERVSRRPRQTEGGESRPSRASDRPTEGISGGDRNTRRPAARGERGEGRSDGYKRYAGKKDGAHSSARPRSSDAGYESAGRAERPKRSRDGDSKPMGEKRTRPYSSARPRSSDAGTEKRTRAYSSARPRQDKTGSPRPRRSEGAKERDGSQTSAKPERRFSSDQKPAKRYGRSAPETDRPPRKTYRAAPTKPRQGGSQRTTRTPTTKR
jgi:23S rRNA pseudouridine1911/1915/1917 synthase